MPRLRRFALTLTRSEDAADDLVQGAVERALARLESWRPETRLDSWLFKITQNLWIDEVRRRRTRSGLEGDPELGEGVAGSDGRHIVGVRQELQAALSAVLALPDDQRALVALVIVEGLSYREAADVLDVPIGTVMSRLARARATLEAAVHGG